ncbi:MAG: HEAT repeat domain-containing protein [Deltaproteobacteria bacterium]|nr:HEAT repeat domain-containing protein [Deltaproteobacteria bacterium]
MKTGALWMTLLVSVSLVGSSCGNKAKESAKSSNPSQAQGAKNAGKAPPPAQVIPAPAALPKVGPDGVATRFPAVVKVSPPAALTSQLKDILKKIEDKQYKVRREAYTGLNGLVKVHSKDMVLARFLVTSGNSRVADYAFRILNNVKSNPDFLAVVVSLMGHPSDFIRFRAVGLMSFKVSKETMAKAMPFIRALLKDKSCVVRREALSVVTTQSRRGRKVPVKALQAALKDECPAVRAYAMMNAMFATDPKKPDAALVKQLSEAALKSDYAVERCAAMLGLGRLKVPGAEKIIAKGFTMQTVPTLVVRYLSSSGVRPFSSHSSMPACATDAMVALTGKHASGKPVDRVKYWMTEMAKKHLARRPGKGFCLGRRDCKQDAEVCLNMRCKPYAKATSAYWKYVALKHCEAKRPTTKWYNFISDAAVKAGFGLHWNAEWKLRLFLRKKDPKAFAKKEKAIKANPLCPKTIHSRR